MDWSAFISTIVGAGVSIVTSLVVFGFTSSTEKRRIRAAEKKRSAFLAFTGLQKTIHFANELKVTKLHLDRAFENAENHGLSDAQHFQKIQPILSAKLSLEPVKVEEMFFLVDLKLAHIMAEIDVTYRRVLNTEAVVTQFNAMKLEFIGFVERTSQTIEANEGARVAFELSGNDATLAALKGRAMNDLIEQLLEHLDRNYAEAKRLAEVFLDAAQTSFGSDFPNIKLSWEY